PQVVAQVEVTLDGNRYDLELTSNGESLLEAGLRIGLDLPFACKGGVCCTCKAKLLEGQVEMDVNWGLEPEELEAGYILTCQSHPKTERIRLTYDI
ncbi:MAG: phenylacetic acid degradation protein, partial [Bacteroidetes bacterium]